MGFREDVDLWLILTDPIEARKYIAEFDWGMPKPIAPRHLTLESGRAIDFAQMSDEDAVIAAMEILRSVEVPQIMREKQYELWEQ